MTWNFLPIEGMELLALLFLLCLAVLSIWGKSKMLVTKYSKVAFFSILVSGILVGIYNSFLQYFAWGDNELTQYLLPPYDPTYFYFYVLMRIWGPYIISFVLALIVIWGLPLINKRYGDRFFEEGENYLAGIVMFLMGHPGWLFYLLEIVGVYLIWHVFNLLMGRGERRLPLYSLWALIGVGSLLINNYFLAETTLWSLLKI